MRVRGEACARILGALAAVICAGGNARAQRLPPPDSSRPPRITQLAASEARTHVRQLHLFELLGSLQRGDTAEIDRALGGVEWRDADDDSRSRVQCRSVGRAVATLAARGARSLNDSLLPVFFQEPSFRDSGDVGLVDVTLVVSGGSQRTGTARVSLVYRDSAAQWTSARGLLKGLCDATGARR